MIGGSPGRAGRGATTRTCSAVATWLESARRRSCSSRSSDAARALEGRTDPRPEQARRAAVRRCSSSRRTKPVQGLVYAGAEKVAARCGKHRGPALAIRAGPRYVRARQNERSSVSAPSVQSEGGGRAGGDQRHHLREPGTWLRRRGARNKGHRPAGNGPSTATASASAPRLPTNERGVRNDWDAPSPRPHGPRHRSWKH